MTQKKTVTFSHPLDGSEVKKSTRIENAPPDLFDPNEPRLGRRESEPHSAEVTYIRDVLTTNFPSSRTLWDLHHYFSGSKGTLKGKEIDIQFDVSFFKDLNVTHTLSSYDARKYEGKIPDLAINVLSKSTWSNDLSEKVDICKDLGISVYAIFSPYKVASKIYDPPFLRVFILKEDKSYKQEDFRSITINEGETIDEKNIIDVSENLLFRLGLMRLKQQHEGEQPLFRLIFIDPSEPRILLSKTEKFEKEKQEAEEKVKKAEEKVKKAEEKAKEAEEKAKKLEKDLIKYREKFGELY